MLANWPVCAMQCLACLLPTLFSHILFFLSYVNDEHGVLPKRPEPDGPRQVTSPFCANLLLLFVLFSTGSNGPWSARNNSANLAIKCQGDERRSEPFELFGPLIFFLPYCLFSGFFSWNTTCNALWQTAGSCSSYLLFQTGQKILVNPKSQILYHRLKCLNFVVFSPRH